MSLKNSTDRWGGISQLLHWTIAVLILTIGAVGLLMGELPRSPKWFWVYTAHKSLGLTVLVLVIVRIAWRLYAGAPDPVPGTPRWQERIATLTHWALYALLIAMPISGWVMNSAAGFPLQWFGLFNLPAIAGKDHNLHELTEGVHEQLFWILVVVATLHAAAAFYHHLFQRDATLTRMLPRGPHRTPHPNETRNDVP